ncbi:flagellar export chaperone FliS [Clostridium chauvoei]|uniref:Flagellar secretion chaperone FliS n=2 Tax=Clostridium chauvoei TaxID=46867 RepID=S6EY83_9CLOT|nr:flagellar export chaperone FliS [Clostridium chauvoei]ATD54622.1 flagellar export chaperone FliS [Clostridium chauvoei]ATD57697.1 flagellar export chaperone FliS [Clostridium chauvoei]MBX7281034.1 flagellar export chaperone FliS [Clostridium chauvoei]MBX7283465.1 flagellar export chaperone FliS [Clostridium chauvoei]MBX7286123.1 flagellar export chaperone FliS [Clostridium chauvoei]
MYGSNAFNVYKNNSVNYASKEQLLLMLVDGAVKFSKIARESLVSKDVKKSHENLVKVQNIFTELMVSLDQSAGEWAEQIFSVYEFIKNKLVEININKDIQALDELMPLIEEIRDIWYEAYEVSKLNR